MIIDIFLIGFLLFALISGFKNGFIPAVLGLIGYLAGGVAGLLVAKRITDDWQGLLTTLIVLVISIFSSALIGQKVARAIGRGFRSLIGPLKVFDGLLGALFTVAKALIFIYFLVSIISISRWESALSIIDESRVIEEISLRVPDSVSKIFEEIKEQVSVP